MKKNNNPEKEETFEEKELRYLKDIPITSSIHTIQFVKPIQMSWQPKEDITTYELALCLPYFYRFNIMPYEVDLSLPHFRHFEINNPNK
jgi:hypothetical protein